MGAARPELLRSRHELDVVIAPAGAARQVPEPQPAAAGPPARGHDWLLIVDDDVALPRGFLDAFLYAAERAGLKVAQPAHRLHSHAAWPVTRRRAGRHRARDDVRGDRAGDGLPPRHVRRLLPFPEGLRMGWGLDVHWAAVAREHGWPIGVVDATPIGHTLRPAGNAYARDAGGGRGVGVPRRSPLRPRDQVRTLAVHR